MRTRKTRKDGSSRVAVIKKQYMRIPPLRMERLRQMLKNEPKSEVECLGEDETITFTAVFGDGYKVDVQVCGVQYREGESNLPYTQAVLYRNGSERCCTEPSEELEGEWHLYDRGTEFIVVII